MNSAIKVCYRRIFFVRNFSSYPSHSVIGMPALSPTMSAGTIAKWLKVEGDRIIPGIFINIFHIYDIN